VNGRIFSLSCVNLKGDKIMFRKSLIIVVSLIYLLITPTGIALAVETDVYPGGSIQNAIDAAKDGDTIYVNAGTYNESLVFNGKDVSSIAVGPVTIMPTSSCTGHGDVIQIYDGTVNIDGFYIDANYSTSGCLGGIYVRSMAMWSENPAIAVISNNTIVNYGKNGITVNGSGADGTILDNIIQGRGPIGLGDWAQNGIQFGWGASGVARGNTTRDNYYTGPDWVATGILLFDVYAVDVKSSQNMFRDNQRNLVLLTDQACPHQFGGVYDDWDLCTYY
jgi:hypothetical protein